MTLTAVNHTAPHAQHESWLHRRIGLGMSPARLLLLGIVALAAFLHLYQLEHIGDANLYYTAAVKSMLQSWHNFFYVAAEPGAAVTVDKPPLGLWLEAASAFVFGVNGFAVMLPNILAGLVSIPLLYHLTKRYFGTTAGLVAALALAVTPVAIAAQRNNTMDGMLTFTLLLAAWAFLRAAETGRLRLLLLGAVIVGLGFNIKMMQAFLPLPAFYGVYLLAAKVSWRRKVAHLAMATAVLVTVSLAWAVAVDMTPEAERPYIGSSTDNTVMELIIGHNGLKRWFGAGGSSAATGNAASQPQFPAAGSFPSTDANNRPVPPPNGQRPPQNNGQFAPPNGGQFTPPADGQPGRPADGGAPGGSEEVGEAGVLRFWQAPLSKELSWLLPLALVGGLLVLLRRRLTLPLAARHQFLLLFGGWLAVGLVFFSFAGFFHAYYLVMLAPPLAALAGAGVAELADLRRTRWGLATAVLFATTFATLAFQWFNASQFVDTTEWMAVAWLLALGGTAVWLWRGRQDRAAQAALALLIAALCVTPLVWSYRTTTETTNVNLPAAYAGDTQQLPGTDDRRTADSDLVAYLQANTQQTDYLLAVPSSMQGAQLVLATGQPVLYMGGFGGSDPVVDAADLAQMVADGALRYVQLSSGGRGGPGGVSQDIAEWVTESCTAVPQFSGLYQCD